MPYKTRMETVEDPVQPIFEAGMDEDHAQPHQVAPQAGKFFQLSFSMNPEDSNTLTGRCVEEFFPKITRHTAKSHVFRIVILIKPGFQVGNPLIVPAAVNKDPDGPSPSWSIRRAVPRLVCSLIKIHAMNRRLSLLQSRCPHTRQQCRNRETVVYKLRSVVFLFNPA